VCAPGLLGDLAPENPDDIAGIDFFLRIEAGQVLGVVGPRGVVDHAG